ncbi:hypothetical protein [Streptomyces sp. MA15]|uniref:hypothetical protein n=1 Tax=Streptomyces sp. MA15 TaxID=3055061 RepID=UPI0025AFD9E1|nr:hypothetical protein [Streptomyces sp. MA15]MDN3266595.1 hypothetical protein [Streptomyces sp. MA15]
MRKKFAAILVSVLAFTGFTFASAPAAQAADYGCSGSLIDSYSVRTNGGTGTKYGTLNLYYSSANGGTNCASVVDTYFGSSVKKYMQVYIYRCTSGTNAGQYCDYDQSDNDTGDFYSYAGPASVTGAASRCIMVFGRIDHPSSGSVATASTLATHCG